MIFFSHKKRSRYYRILGDQKSCNHTGVPVQTALLYYLPLKLGCLMAGMPRHGISGNWSHLFCALCAEPRAFAAAAAAGKWSIEGKIVYRVLWPCAQTDGTSFDKSQARKLESRRTENGEMFANYDLFTTKVGRPRRLERSGSYHIDVESFVKICYFFKYFCKTGYFKDRL